MKLLKFEASWCQPCKSLSQTLSTMTLPFPVCPIDIDNDRESAVFYGIRGVPHMILMDENENILLRIGGNVTKSQLEEALSPYIGAENGQ